MADRTPEQVLKEEQSKLGRDQGKIFNALKNQIIWLDVKWKEYKILFESTDSIAILEATAPFYFYLTHQMMLDDILLHLQKITSPVGGEFPYLSIRRLPKLLRKRFSISLQSLVDDAVTKASFSKDRRDRYIAHYSLDLVVNSTARPLEAIRSEDVEEAISALKKLVTFIYNEVLGTGIFLDVIYPLENANALLRRLKMTIVDRPTV